MDIEIEKTGLILEGEEKGWYVLIKNDNLDTAGYQILTFSNLDPADNHRQCFDAWVESFDDLQDYFVESRWKIQWIE